MKRKIIAAAMLLMFGFQATTAVGAQVVTNPENTESVQSLGVEITPFAEVIKTITRYNKVTGLLEFRRWNETKGYWVDAYWRTY